MGGRNQNGIIVMHISVIYQQIATIHHIKWYLKASLNPCRSVLIVWTLGFQLRVSGPLGSLKVRQQVPGQT